MASTEAVYNHIVLPPKLPDHQDTHLDVIEVELFNRLIHACESLDRLCRPSRQIEALADVSKSLKSSLELSRNELDVDRVLSSFEWIEDGSMILYHVREQNAALIISKPKDGNMRNTVVEAFELSPRSTDVLSSKDALLCEFPGRGVELSPETFNNPSFRSNLARFLEQACRESLSIFSARANKSAASVAESRDTKDPALISQCLMAILEGLGNPVEVLGIQKRIMDDVNLGTSEIPWRRAPLWLGLRVMTQLQLYRALGDTLGRVYYKLLSCVILAELLGDTSGKLHVELSVLLKAKLCRRLAKLQSVASRESKALLDPLHGFFETVISSADETLNNAWASYKCAIIRKIPTLPRFATASNLVLPLPRSKVYLNDRIKSRHLQIDVAQARNSYPEYDEKAKQAQLEAKKYYDLFLLEEDIKHRQLSSLTNASKSDRNGVVSLANVILSLFSQTQSLHLGPDQRSTFVLNVFDVWVELDKSLNLACPLSCEYDIPFTPELLDVLQLHQTDHVRLRRIQEYIVQRKRLCKHQGVDILSDIGPQCFAVRFVSQSEALQQLQSRIQRASEAHRAAKEAEWVRTCHEYEKHVQGASQGSCVCATGRDGVRVVKGCKRCWHWRSQKRMKIACHEDFLPTDAAQSAATVFELAIPSYVDMYRQIIWKMVVELAHPDRPTQSSAAAMILGDYSQLKAYGTSRQQRLSSVTLASQKKSFLQTHFNNQRMKVESKDVLLPNGLEFAYYDSEMKLWIQDLSRPLTLQHLFGIHIPRCLVKSVLDPLEHPPPRFKGPSSYEIVTGQTKCPPGVSKLEFTSFQRLLSAEKLRWVAILSELNASNINFSSEDTMLLLTQLAAQVGPSITIEGDAVDYHHFLGDPSFCARLIQVLQLKFSAIKSNWREHHCMTIIIIMLLRMMDTSVMSASHRRTITTLLVTARSATLQWIKTLRAQIMHATDPGIVNTATRYGFWAAVLCRRTFAHVASTGSEFTKSDVNVFVQATLGLRENFVLSIQDVPQTLRYLATSDLKMAQALRPELVKALLRYPAELEMAIKATWGDTESVDKSCAHWVFQASPHENWVSTEFRRQVNGRLISQTIDYNFLEGYLLVNSKPLGRLPNSIGASMDVQDLFGNKHLLTFPATFNGLSYRLGTQMMDQEIYFGTKDDRVIIQALSKGGLYELIPRRVFRDSHGFDLPASMLDECVHWLNLDSGHLEIRRKPDIWKTKESDWVIDLASTTATRRRVRLVSPQSSLFHQITQIIGEFEIPDRITVYQPTRGRLSVELRNLDLNFFVNDKGLLECRELKSEIDPNQDSGTFYGLKSQIVLRDISNPDRRSIITSSGQLRCERHGMHVRVIAASTSSYGRYDIDTVLGRLTCAQEPLLIYLKARFHAFTSFALPDPLTGRTGQEEALAILNSGQSSPWTVLSPMPASILLDIKSLSPIREYYPAGMKRLQKCVWRDDSTLAMQGDRLHHAVIPLLRRSQELDTFIQNTGQNLYAGDPPDHLRDRATSQRQRYERSFYADEVRTPRVDAKYKSRDKQLSSSRSVEVYRTVALLSMKEFNFGKTRSLANTLELFEIIGGFQTVSTPELALSSVMDLDLGQQWGGLSRIFSQSDRPQDYGSMFRLAVLAFNPNLDLDAIRLLTAFSRIPEMQDITWPGNASFTAFKHHEVPKKKDLQNLILQDYPAPQGRQYSRRKKQEYAEDEKYEKCLAESKMIADFFYQQWPSGALSIEELDTDLVDPFNALQRVEPEWKRLYQNELLSRLVDRVQSILDRYHRPLTLQNPHAWTNRDVITIDTAALATKLTPSMSIISSNEDLESHQVDYGELQLPPQELPVQDGMIAALPDSHANAAPSTPKVELRRIIRKFSESTNEVRSRYGADLAASLKVLLEMESSAHKTSDPPSHAWIESSIQTTQHVLIGLFTTITGALHASEVMSGWLRRGNLWPCCTPVGVLELLRASSTKTVNKSFRDIVIVYARQLTVLRWLIRLRVASSKSEMSKLVEEWANPGHNGWRVRDHTEWLLMEAESDIMIREEQHNVAKEVILPRNGHNTVLQLNMGRGKTSCIMPMAAIELANGTRLVRLVVPKPLLLQTAQTLQSRLGGLIGRRLVHIPFSRRTKTTDGILQLYSQLHRSSLKSGDIILTTPEHLMSFKLSGRQRLVDGNIKEAEAMMTFQDWLETNSRDILDESDLSLSVKTQLVYPSGTQVAVDGHPYRWKVAQALLSLVEDELPSLAQRYPKLIEIVPRGNGFPLVYILREDVEEALNESLINHISDTKISLLETKNEFPRWISSKIRELLTGETPDRRAVEAVLPFFKDPEAANKIILTCRGLLSCKVLLLCLKKRWGTQYGLNPQRDPIAVPYEAKGVPSEQSEFGHPDVSIVLTCLSFYYAGLSILQFHQGLSLVLQADDPAIEYDKWSNGLTSLPPALQQWSVINLDDKMQVQELWKRLRHSRSVLDHYMNNFVFPQHAKQFQVKLQSSGWDLPLFPSQAATTGFSGTNDNKMLLPLTISQNDLPELHQTSAEVLGHLLETRNQGYHVAINNKKRVSEEELLHILHKQGIRILIDAGAHIMENDNRSLAELWIKIDWEAKAAVYFGADNRAWVHYRGGRDLPLLATPFAENFENCLVYLDENHTRGVDMKFPPSARGALTLALNQTKDHTVQAAMRLRKLGLTQSITWFAPPEVDQSIRDFCKPGPLEEIKSPHVVAWLLEQSCRSNEQLQTLWIAQGRDFCRRFDAVARNKNATTDVVQRARLLKAIEQPEVHSLDQLYGNPEVSQQEKERTKIIKHPALKPFIREFDRRRQNSHFDNAQQASALEEVEQERQVTQEVQEVRQTQAAPHMTALKFPGPLPAIEDFVRTGILEGGHGFVRAMEVLVQTSLGIDHGVSSTGSRVWVTREFMRTVLRKGKKTNDNFLRPVEYILFSTATHTALIVIPEEAEAVFPLLYSQEVSRVHMIPYAVPVTKNMLRFSDLSFYAFPALPARMPMPRWLTTEIGIIAGRLYFHFHDYAQLKALVAGGSDAVNSADRESASSAVSESGEASSISSPDMSAISSVDGGDAGDAAPALSICSRPAPFLISYLAMRRHGQDILSTPMGYICQGRPLTEKHAFFADSQGTAQGPDSAVRSEIVDEMEEQDEGGESGEEDDGD